MTKIIFRSGLTTIGGTIIELIKDNNRLIFDFGTVFNPGFDEETIPNVIGIYDNTSIYNDAVLISHLHLDHIKAINLIPDSTPIYMSDASNDFLLKLKSVNFNDIMGEWRNYSGIAFNTLTNILGFDVTFLPVDHDVTGASAILIENEDISILYSGDLRIHGKNPDQTLSMINDVKNKHLDLSIFEGVTISFVEDDAVITASNLVSETENDFANSQLEATNPYRVVYFNSYIMGHERLCSIFELGSLTNRTVVLTEEFATLYQDLIPFNYLVLNKDIDIETIKLDQKRYLLQFVYANKELYILNEPTMLLQTGGEPLGAYDPRYQELIDYCNQYQITLNACGLGGHASPENLLWISEQVAAKYIMPLHSFKPHLLKPHNSIQIMPQQDFEYEFIQHEFVKKS